MFLTVILIVTIVCLLINENKDDRLKIVVGSTLAVLSRGLYLILYRLYYYINYGSNRCWTKNNRESSFADEKNDLTKRTINPTRITLRHSFTTHVVKLNYIIHFFVHTFRTIAIHLKLIQQHPANAKNVCELILNTSTGLYTKFTRLSDNLELMEFYIDNFAFPEIINRYDNKLMVSAEIEDNKELKGRNISYKIIRFEFNGIEIRDFNEQLTIIGVLVAIGTHPIIHSFFDQLYNFDFNK